MESFKKTKKLLHTFMRRLTNLSSRNKSLLLLKPSDAFIDLHNFSQLNLEKSFGIIEALLKERSKVICPVVDPRMEVSNEASLKLKKINRLDQFYYDERGVRDLHVGWPMVHGKLMNGALVRCPLLFFPVELKTENEHWVLSFRAEGEILFNKSFLLSYSFYNQCPADEKLLSENFEDYEREPVVFLTSLYRLLEKSLAKINFNPELYTEVLNSFTPYTKKDFEEQHRAGELKLHSEAVLGLFPQAGSSLVPDYEQLIDENSFTDLEEFFGRNQLPENPSLNFISQVREDKIYPVFPMDIWQENALKAAKLGCSFIVQGPPGTGKSQLIANLISDGMANEKRILLVCQKRVALDVVYERLKERNLENFIALVHDFKNDRRELFQKIAGQINRTDEYKTNNISLDAILLDRKFLQVSKSIDQITEELEHFRWILFDETESGKSIKELYLQSSLSAPSVSLKHEYFHFRFNDLDLFLRNLNDYSAYAQQVDYAEYPLFDRVTFSRFTVADLPEMQHHLQDVFPFFENTRNQFSGLLSVVPDWEMLKKLAENENALEELHTLTKPEEVFTCFKKMLPKKSSETNSLWLSNIERMVNDCFVRDGVETSVPSASLGHFQRALHRAMKARKGLWSWLRWQVFSKDKLLITRALVANGLTSKKEDLQTLERKLDQRLNLEHNLSKLKNKNWLLNIPSGLQAEELSVWFAHQQAAIKAKTVFNSIRILKNIFNPAHYSHSEFINRLEKLIVLIHSVQLKSALWAGYLSVRQIEQLTKDSGLCSILLSALQKDFDLLCEFDKLKERFSEPEKNTIKKLTEKSPKGSDWPNLFLNSLALSWIDHIETKHPELRMVSSGKIQRLESELQEQIEAKSRLTTEILLLRARERVTDDLEFNRLNNRVTYRDLLHQTTKKKKIWPLRRVVTEFENEVFRLLPCWMASPESVSAIFPMKEMFDLVIFDEASQCFAEQGIPALYRGKQAVIAGDRKQLSPGDFYQARWQDDEPEEPDAEVDSLLLLAERYLFSLKLRGHYRSQSPELVDFSNRHFYEGSLQVLPEFHHYNKGKPAIEYINVSGTWANQTNEQEANYIANLVLTVLNEHPKKEIGIVTFNAPQQTLIQDVIEELFQKNGKTISGNIFIKNIENVQGDERDLIIFSVGYARDKNGIIHAQFGSLNREGGENRLNVAISRAREKIMVVTSLLPEELNVSETKNQGPKLLKDYLAFAREVSSGYYKPYTNKQSNHTLSNQLKNEMLTDAPALLDKKLSQHVFPFHDLTLLSGDAIQAGIFTDDHLYFESLSPKADHALFPLLMRAKNWPYLRLYSRNFWIDRKKFWSQVERA
ncbi:MAG: DUF4011 domain-containing protein [Bacteroidetes bacterium]|nr:DUF4011 domain-containing protein [Bacteroidota bacterium]MBS1981009.1 DUF4011 domain-containing protein [Bacteroidota bacterium]